MALGERIGAVAIEQIFVAGRPWSATLFLESS
jgi:hypothetical protein